jgi:hypothetical protein
MTIQSSRRRTTPDPAAVAATLYATWDPFRTMEGGLGHRARHGGRLDEPKRAMEHAAVI